MSIEWESGATLRLNQESLVGQSGKIAQLFVFILHS